MKHRTIPAAGQRALGVERRTTVAEEQEVLVVSRRPLRTGGHEVQAFVATVTAVHPFRAEYMVTRWLYGENVAHRVEVGSMGGFTLTLPPHELAACGVFVSKS